MKKTYSHLNKKQIEAVKTTEGPVLVLAGAGSGKTSVLTHRIAHLVHDNGINPYNIMAITFTNKAAGEMKARIGQMIGNDADQLWMATFHSSCCKILRKHAKQLKLGYENNFAIYDDDDKEKMLKAILRKLEMEELITLKDMKRQISMNKINFIDAKEYTIQANNYYDKKIANVYRVYERDMRKSNAMDFEDLLNNTMKLLEENTDILAEYQKRFQYIMIDEYQDTDLVQTRFINAIAKMHRNICVVGDDDQSIYKFRGADTENIINFLSTYQDVKVIKLEQNYRCTKNVLMAANTVILHNQNRMGKTLWTENEIGSKVHFHRFSNANKEAQYIIGDIMENHEQGIYDYKENAILYRTNAQSRALEEVLIGENIPYEIVGSITFYQRQEIKDLLAYLHIIDNSKDDLALMRIVNVPNRKIGAKTIEKITEYAELNEISMLDAMADVKKYMPDNATSDSVYSFSLFIKGMIASKEYYGINKLMDDILETIDYIQYLEDHEKNAKDKIDNVYELSNKIDLFMKSNSEATLSDFLNEISLINDREESNKNTNKVVLMTVHSAKGLEFEHVYLSGMEEDTFPMNIDEDGMESERRLAYVAITRAKKELDITCAKMRNMRGRKGSPYVSRFVYEISEGTIDRKIPAQEETREPFIDDELIKINSYDEKSLKKTISDRVSKTSYVTTELSALEEARKRGTTEVCINSIRQFYSRTKRQYTDFYMLKTGGRDNLSEKYIEDLVELVGIEAFNKVKEKLKEQKDIEAALRWIGRGLLVGDAIRKVKMNNKKFA